MLRPALHAVGYVIAHVLFLGANTPESVVRRLRLAYRLVGVKVIETPEVNGTERTIFLCPYRNLAAKESIDRKVCVSRHYHCRGPQASSKSKSRLPASMNVS